MSEAVAHRAIEFGAWVVPNPDLLHDPALEYEQLTQSQKHALEVYSGNWMRDFSQAFVPFVLNAVSGTPRYFGHPTETTPLGAEGAEKMVTETLRALAMLEFDHQITDSLIKAEHIKQYRPEEHLDNPAGLPFTDLLVRVNGKYEGANTRNPVDNTLMPVSGAKRQEIDRQLSSSAFQGHQVENPVLSGVGPLGMNHFIYGTSQWIKALIDQAIGEPDAAKRRMLFGTALHGIEDYFAHSNFIEIAIEFILVNPAQFPGHDGLRQNITKRNGDIYGRWVDTLYDVHGAAAPAAPAQPDELVGRERRYAVTTGTFGGTDTQVSIAHILLPKVGHFGEMIDQASQVLVQMSIDAYLGVYPSNMPEAERAQQRALAQQIRGNGGPNPRQARAIKLWMEGIDASGLRFPSIVDSGINFPARETIAGLSVGGIFDNFLTYIDTNMPGLYGARLPAPAPGYEIPSTAFRTYREFKHFVSNVVTGINGVIDRIPDIPAAVEAVLPNSLKQALRSMREYRTTFMHQLDRKLAGYLKERMYETFEKMIGMPPVDPADRADPARWAARVRAFVHDKEGRTFGRTPDHIAAGSPPSHSEVSKDHPIINAASSDTMEHGSPFYTLHFELAKSAIQHLMREFELRVGAPVVAGNGAAADGRAQLFDARNRAAEAFRSKAVREAQMISRRMEADNASGTLHKAVDLYMAHPLSSHWWYGIVNAQLRVQDFHNSINRRNRTRSERA